jgi:hypothetical protein
MRRTTPGTEAGGRPLHFYFTAHPNDFSRQRLPQGITIMLVAAAHWDATRRRFRLRRPPADWVTALAIDSGGFTAHRRWGEYPWSPVQYADFIAAVSRDIPLAWCAVMDYACEPGVDRRTWRTNTARIEATIVNDAACRAVAPDLPWLSVLQGDTLAERDYDLAQRQACSLVPATRAGMGSICGRPFPHARRVLDWYRTHLPGVRFHVFGMDCRVLDGGHYTDIVASWDSYAWNWERGTRNVRRGRQPLETYTTYTGRLARRYLTETIQPRLSYARQLTLWEAL